MSKFSLNSKMLRAAALGAIALALGCEQDGLAPVLEEDLESGDFVIVNDEASLSRRMRSGTGDTLRITGPAPMAGEFAVIGRGDDDDDEDENRIVLTRVAHVDPPDNGRAPMQATHIATKGSKTYVSYATVGAEYGGAIDVISTGGRVRLISQALLADGDAFTVYESSSRLYVGLGMARVDLASPALLAEVHLRGGKLTDRYRTVDLPSYVTTGAVRRGDHVYATVGASADGGLFRVNLESFDASPLELHDDARSVDVGDGYIASFSGTPGVLRVYDRHGAALGEYAIGGANVAESKSVVAIADGFAFVAAGDAGLKVVRLSDGVVVADMPVLDMMDGSTADHVTNGVSINRNLVFLANGAGGLYVLRFEVDDDDVELEHVGHVGLDEGMSVNHVGTHGRTVLVASGNGGLQVIGLSRGDDDDDDDDN